LPQRPLRFVAEQNKNEMQSRWLESMWKMAKKPVAGWCAETLRH
jgi:hypothetical protein